MFRKARFDFVIHAPDDGFGLLSLFQSGRCCANEQSSAIVRICRPGHIVGFLKTVDQPGHRGILNAEDISDFGHHPAVLPLQQKENSGLRERDSYTLGCQGIVRVVLYPLLHNREQEDEFVVCAHGGSPPEI